MFYLACKLQYNVTMRTAAWLIVVLLSASCMSQASLLRKRTAGLRHDVQRYMRFVRWNELEMAAAFASEDFRKELLVRRLQSDGTVHITDFGILELKLDDKAEQGTVDLWLKHYNQASLTTGKRYLRLGWRFQDGAWKLVEEKELSL